MPSVGQAFQADPKEVVLPLGTHGPVSVQAQWVGGEQRSSAGRPVASGCRPHTAAPPTASPHEETGTVACGRWRSRGSPGLSAASPPAPPPSFGLLWSHTMPGREVLERGGALDSGFPVSDHLTAFLKGPCHMLGAAHPHHTAGHPVLSLTVTKGLPPPAAAYPSSAPRMWWAVRLVCGGDMSPHSCLPPAGWAPLPRLSAPPCWPSPAPWEALTG